MARDATGQRFACAGSVRHARRAVRAVLAAVAVALVWTSVAHAQNAPRLEPPRLIEAPEVALPDGAEPLPDGSAVGLRVTIDATGAVTDASVEDGVRADVDALVLEAARRMRFSPATRDGAPVSATVRFRYAVSSPPEAGASGGSASGASPPRSGEGGARGGDEGGASGGSASGASPPRSGEGGASGGSASGASPPRSGEGGARGGGVEDAVSEAREGAAGAAPERRGAEPPAEDAVSEAREGAAGAAPERRGAEPPAEESFSARARIRAPEPGASARVTLRAEELTTVPGTFGEPLRVVAALPGVARSPFNLGYFVVRGASFQNTGFFVDGFPVPILYHLGFGPAILSSRFVGQLDFYPGGYPTRFGLYSAGVISLTTQPPPFDHFHLEVEVDPFRASALAAVPFDDGKGMLSAAVRRSYYELLLPLFVDNVDLGYGDWQVRLDYRFSHDVEASVFYMGSNDALSIATPSGAGVGDSETRTELGYDFQRVIGKLALRLPEGGRLVWSAMVGDDRTGFGSRDPGGASYSLDLDAITLGERLELTAPIGERYETRVGVDMYVTSYDATSTLPVPPDYGEYPKPLLEAESTDVAIQPLLVAAAPYLEQVIRFDPVELTIGARAQYLKYALVSRWEADPRLVLRVRAADRLVLKAATGLFTQLPLPIEIAETFGNPHLRPQRSFQSSGGFELDLPLDIRVESQVFYNRMFRLPRATPNLVEDPDGTVRRQVYADDGEGRSYGLELLIRRELADGFYGWLSYTLAWSERETIDGEIVPFNYDQRHNLSLALSYQLGGWRFGARFTLSSGRPTRPVLGAEWDADCDCFEAMRGSYTDRLPLFHQLDIRVDSGVHARRSRPRHGLPRHPERLLREELGGLRLPIRLRQARRPPWPSHPPRARPEARI